MDFSAIPQFCLNFLLRYKTYSKEARPAQALQIEISHHYCSPVKTLPEMRVFTPRACARGKAIGFICCLLSVVVTMKIATS